MATFTLWPAHKSITAESSCAVKQRLRACKVNRNYNLCIAGRRRHLYVSVRPIVHCSWIVLSLNYCENQMEAIFESVSPQTDSHAQKWILAWSARDADEMSFPNQSVLWELLMNPDVTAVTSDLQCSPQSQLSFFLTVVVNVSPSPCVVVKRPSWWSEGFFPECE